MTTPLTKTSHAITRALSLGKQVSYQFPDGADKLVTFAAYVKSPQCIAFMCDGEKFRAYPSQLHRFAIEQ